MSLSPPPPSSPSQSTFLVFLRPRCTLTPHHHLRTTSAWPPRSSARKQQPEELQRVRGVPLRHISVLVILGANVFLFIFIPRLSAFERHQNKSQQEETIMLRLYFFQVFNTVVASLIMWDATQNSAGKADWPHWFADGGYFLFSVMIGDALLMNSIEYFRPFDMLIPRYITGRKVVTQQRLNRLYSLPTFSLGMRFQFVLKSATIALLFGSALPILYFVSAATLLLTYAIDKYLVSAFRLETGFAFHLHQPTRFRLISCPR